MNAEPLAWIKRTAALAADACAATALAGIMILMVIDVTGRYFLNHPVPGAAEVIELAMAILVFSALPMTTLKRGHVALDYLETLSPRAISAVLRSLIDIATALVLGFLAWRLALKSLTILRYGDTTPYLGWPIAPVAIFVTSMTAVTALLLLARTLISPFTSRRSEEPAS